MTNSEKPEPEPPAPTINPADPFEIIPELLGRNEDRGLARSEEAGFGDLRRRSLSQDIDMRKHFAWALFGLLACWMVFVAVCFMFSGFKLCSFQLSDTTLVALLAGSTINIIGLFAHG